MKPIRPLLLSAALLLGSVLLSSCWHMGVRQRNADTTYTGVDIFHPVDGKIHHAQGTDKNGVPYGYVVAPEVTYQVLGPAFHPPMAKPDPAEAEYLRPTGRVVVARITPAGFKETVPSLPQGLRATEVPSKDAHAEYGGPYIMTTWRADSAPLPSELGALSERKEKPGVGRRFVTGFCDYVLDPLLDLATVPLACAAYVVGAPLMGLGYVIVHPAQQQQLREPLPAPPPAP